MPRARDEVVDLARGDAVDIGLDDHGVEGLVDAASSLEHRGEEAATRSFGIRSAMSPALVDSVL